MTETSPALPFAALPFADFDRWITTSWYTDRRYYRADIMQDLFGTWLLKRSWGSLRSGLGNNKTLVARDYEHALTLLEEVVRQRQRRGYVRVA